MIAVPVWHYHPECVGVFLQRYPYTCSRCVLLGSYDVSPACLVLVVSSNNVSAFVRLYGIDKHILSVHQLFVFTHGYLKRASRTVTACKVQRHRTVLQTLRKQIETVLTVELSQTDVEIRMQVIAFFVRVIIVIIIVCNCFYHVYGKAAGILHSFNSGMLVHFKYVFPWVVGTVWILE